MSVPKQQKVLYLFEKGGPLVVQNIDVPSPGPDDVLIKVEAAGLNPVDGKIQALGVLVQSWPQILGFDGAGTVVAIGSNVTNLKVGDRVAVQGQLDSTRHTFQQYVATSSDITIGIPPSLSFDDAATLPVAVGTSAIPLYNKHESAKSVKLVAPWEEGGKTLYAGKPVVVLGGASSVGQAVLQFLRLSGFSPIITTASLRNADIVKSVGATHVVDRSLPSAALIEEIQKIAGGPIELVYDSISASDTLKVGYDLVAPGGSLVIVSHFHDKLPEYKEVNVVTAFGMLAVPENHEFSARLAREVERLLEQGLFKPLIAEVLPGGLNGVQAGIDRLNAGQVSARKLVVRPHETT
ncbi:GroES-like protein [Fomes fomentarius]|nr:GroES-like protein [Fomes fomentarius]